MSDYKEQTTRPVTGVVGTPALAVRNDKPGDISGADNNHAMTQLDSAGALRVTQEGGKPTYRCTQHFTCDSTAGDIAFIQGNGTVDQQTVACSYTPTGGTFSLTFTTPAGQSVTIAGIPYNVTAAKLQSMLAANSAIGQGNVWCTGGALPGTAIVVNFTGDLAGPQSAMTVNYSGLTGGTPGNMSVTHTTTGVLGTVLKLNRITISTTASAEAVGLLELIRKSSAGSGGTVATANQNITPNDVTDPATNATFGYLTAHNTALGTAVGVIHCEQIAQQVATSAQATRIEINFVDGNGAKAPRISGSADYLFLNVAAALGGSGNVWALTWDYTEESSYA